MLSVVRNAGNGQKYAIFSEGSAAAGWAISLTDGVLVWKGDAVINGDSRPASRSQESSVFYMDKVTSALSSSNLAAGEEERFSFDIIERDPHLSLVVKEKVLGTSTLTVLLKLGLSLFAGDEQQGGLTPMLLTLQAISSSLNTLISTVRTMEASAESSKMIIDTLCRDMDALTATKDRLQDDMIQKMAVVLGSKKQEIARLRAIVSDYEMHSASSRKLFEDNEAEAKAPAPKKRKTAAEGDPKAKKASKTASVDAIKDKVSGKLKGRKKAAVSDQEDNGSDQQEEEEDLLTSSKVINSIDIKDFLSQTQQLSGHTTQPTVSTLSTGSPDFSYNMNTNTITNGHGRSTGTGIRPGSHFGSDSRSTNSKNSHPADSFDFHAYDLPDTSSSSSSGYVAPKAAVVSSSSSSGGHHHHQGSKSHAVSSLTTNTTASSSSMGSKNSKKAFFEEDSDDETSPVKKKPVAVAAPIHAAGRPPTSKAKAHRAAMDSDDETNNALSYI